ncbi:hypothetical protein ATANTOWER_002131 [Ataeniobius toweri]|uniref:Uncharacterized protein n=1 Tax=Ataeniobius toweri TaxID=208326 RepID=A0ABU7AVF6_9TELE|nr:hypothetical protein [Ataeniobius toweri]
MHVDAVIFVQSTFHNSLSSVRWTASVSSGWMFRITDLKVNLHPNLKAFAASEMLSFRVSMYLAPSIFLSTLTSFRPPKDKHPHRMMLPPPCFIVGGRVQSVIFYHMLAKKFSFGLI